MNCWMSWNRWKAFIKTTQICIIKQIRDFQEAFWRVKSFKFFLQTRSNRIATNEESRLFGLKIDKRIQLYVNWQQNSFISEFYYQVSFFVLREISIWHTERKQYFSWKRYQLCTEIKIYLASLHNKEEIRHSFVATRLSLFGYIKLHNSVLLLLMIVSTIFLFIRSQSNDKFELSLLGSLDV